MRHRTRLGLALTVGASLACTGGRSAPDCHPVVLFLESPLAATFDEAAAAVDHPEPPGGMHAFSVRSDGVVPFLDVPDFGPSYRPAPIAWEADRQHLVIVTGERLRRFDAAARPVSGAEWSGDRILDPQAMRPDGEGRLWLAYRQRSGDYHGEIARFDASLAPSTATPFPEAARGADTSYGLRWARPGRARSASPPDDRMALVWTDVVGGEHVVRAGLVEPSVDPPVGTLLPPITASGATALDALQSDALYVLWGNRGEALTLRVSRWDGSGWSALGGDLGTAAVGDHSATLGVDSDGRLLLATVASDPTVPLPDRTYTLDVRGWDPAASTWSPRHAVPVTADPRTFKDAPLLWVHDGAVHLAWIEETADRGFDTASVAYAIAHDRVDPETLRGSDTAARDVFVVRSDPDGWTDVASNREQRRGLVPARALRFELAVAACE